MVGELSGDLLGAELLKALKARTNDLEVIGVLGPNICALGYKEFANMERLAVMGFIEPLKRLPELIKLRANLIKYFITQKIDLFIAVDAPDFNLRLEKQLKAHGIKTVHYVSPSVWAWRQGRIKLIKQAVDLMLTLLPFEAKFYQDHQVASCFTGHPMADNIPLNIDVADARDKLGLPTNKKIIGILPGSRDGELKYLAKIYIETAKLCLKHNKDLLFVIPVVNEKHKLYIESISQNLPLKIIVNKVRLALAAIDVAMVTSGTATLEVMLHKKPMVVAYKLNILSYYLLKLLIKTKYIALPNLLAGRKIVPEYIQFDAKPQLLASKLLQLLERPEPQRECFIKMHKDLKNNASNTAADAIFKLLSC